MKSRVIKLLDYIKVEFDHEIAYPDVTEALEKDYRRLMKKDKVVEESNIVREEDIVQLDLSCENEKWNKKGLKLNVGKGMFDLALEKELVGLSKEESHEIILEGDAIQVNIHEIKRNVYPPLSEKRVLEWANSADGNSEITSVEQYQNYMKKIHEEQAIDEKKKEIVFDVYGQIYMNSEWDFAEEECEPLLQQIIEEVNEELQGKDATYETITDEQCKKYFDMESKMELEQYLTDSVCEQIAYQLMSCVYAGKDIASCSLEDEIPSSYTFISDYVNQNIKINKQEEK